ncbi:hypothetical protein [Streptomyces netropsis]|uniref:DUF4232 domain-containing protein n=1 Tax=Streptomyces netropsis TaxID=55404 RepID=A0A7W7PI71_STRNE|nr:hypothetical protein [Streptomyces netropsis]MBB4890779.1 hypothetical protein [Streptomyces netropsis]GGR51775.1 hypothetical protein GCM10010219_66080 [Streptomyces netropsis]
MNHHFPGGRRNQDVRKDQEPGQDQQQHQDCRIGQIDEGAGEGQAGEGRLGQAGQLGPVGHLDQGFGTGTAAEGGVSDGDMAAGDVDEQALRRLLHGAVDDLEPSADALEHLRRAVPARRTRRRQVVVGVAAAVILGGTAMPALLRVATTVGTADDRPANAASSQQTDEGTAEGRRSGGGEGREPEEGSSHPADRKDEEHKEERKGEDARPESHAGGAPGGPLPGPTSTLAATSPTCDRNQLGNGAGSVGAADREGRVYGSFRVVNVSHAVCTVGGPGAVDVAGQGSAETSRVSVVDHTAGDAATGLPDPSTEPSEVILQPGQAYEVKFAWIPASGGGPSGCANGGGGASPSPAASTPPASGTTAMDQPTGQDTPEPKPPASVVVSHTPDTGEPAAADAKINDACAGTVYRTGPLGTKP